MQVSDQPETGVPGMQPALYGWNRTRCHFNIHFPSLPALVGDDVNAPVTVEVAVTTMIDFNRDSTALRPFDDLPY